MINIYISSTVSLWSVSQLSMQVTLFRFSTLLYDLPRMCRCKQVGICMRTGVFHNASITMRCLGTRQMDITSTYVQVVDINAHSHRELSLVDVDPCTPVCGVLSIIQPGKIYLTTPRSPSKGKIFTHCLTHLIYIVWRVGALPTTCHGMVEICMTICRFSTGH